MLSTVKGDDLSCGAVGLGSISACGGADAPRAQLVADRERI